MVRKALKKGINKMVVYDLEEVSKIKEVSEELGLESANLKFLYKVADL